MLGAGASRTAGTARCARAAAGAMGSGARRCQSTSTWATPGALCEARRRERVAGADLNPRADVGARAVHASIPDSSPSVPPPLSSHSYGTLSGPRYGGMQYPPRAATHDLVSSPHPVSHIRLLLLRAPADESPAEREYRERREQLAAWHHAWWERNNAEFEAKKTEFVEEVHSTTGAAPTPTALASFYKSHLAATRDRHMAYNRAWWRANFALLVPGLRAEWARVARWAREGGRSGARAAALEFGTGRAAAGVGVAAGEK